MKKYVLDIVRRICGTKQICDDLAKIRTQLEALSKGVHAVRNNMIQLSLPSETIWLDDGNKTFPMYRGEDGKLFFTPPEHASVQARERGNIFFVTLPKSGTHFWMKILEECGYIKTDADNVWTICVDIRNIPSEKFFQTPLTEIYVEFPFYLHTQCLRPKEFILGHTNFSCSKYIHEEKFLICVREFRTTIVSLLRFVQRMIDYRDAPWYSLGPTEEALYLFVQSSTFEWQINMCKEIIKWIQAFPDRVVRFEALDQPGSAEYADVVEKLCRVTELDADTVAAAIERARGAKTLTYTGKKSSLDGIWSERIEERFRAMQCHILNEQMGYSRDWKPA